MIIPLGPGSLRDSSSLPEGRSVHSCERNAYGLGQPSPPIWPCSTRGFPCPGCRHPGGGLLPHLFTLAKCARPKQAGLWFFRKPAAEVQASPAVYFLWHFPWPRLRVSPSRNARRNPLALPGASPCSPTLLRAEDYGSPDFPPVCFACAKYTGDHPTHPLRQLYGIAAK